jgi:membrane-associated phospholipid phosphatase
MLTRGWVRIAYVLSAFLFATAARAEPPRVRDVQLWMDGRPAIDLTSVAVGGTSLLLSSFIFAPRVTDIAPLDGLGHRARSHEADRASNLLLGFGLIGGLGGAFAGELVQRSTGDDRARGPLVVSEGALFASAVVHVIKDLGAVCRPRDWQDDEHHCGVTGEPFLNDSFARDESRRSFPSGHVTPIAGMMGAAYGLWLLPTGRRDDFAPLALSLTAIAGSLVVLRERAGAHSWVDTSTAFVLGGAIGFATAALHLQSSSHAATAAEAPSSKPQVTFGGTF